MNRRRRGGRQAARAPRVQEDDVPAADDDVGVTVAVHVAGAQHRLAEEGRAGAGEGRRDRCGREPGGASAIEKGARLSIASEDGVVVSVAVDVADAETTLPNDMPVVSTMVSSGVGEVNPTLDRFIARAGVSGDCRSP